MKINHDVIRPIVAVAVGLLLAVYVYRLATDPAPAARLAQERAVVEASREILQRYVAPAGSIDIVDPLSPDRKVGKSYIYPAADGWEVSGYYRRGEPDRWHPYLMALSADSELRFLSVEDSDAGLVHRALGDPKLVVSTP